MKTHDLYKPPFITPGLIMGTGNVEECIIKSPTKAKMDLVNQVASMSKSSMARVQTKISDFFSGEEEMRKRI